MESQGERTVRLQLTVAAAFGVVSGAAGSWAYARTGASAADIVRDLAVGWAYVVAGIVAWRSRPANHTGRLMVIEGVTWFFGNLQGTSAPALFAFGAWFEALNMAVLLHLILSFPEGRLTTVFTRRLTQAGYALVAVGGLVRTLLFDPAADTGATYLDCRGCGPNLLLVRGWRGAFEAVDTAYHAAGWVLSVFVAVAVVQRWRQASAARRRALLPAWIGIAVAVVFLMWDMLFYVVPWFGGVGSLGEQAVYLMSDLAQVGVPFAFLGGLLRMHMQRGEVSGLVIDVGTDPDATRVRDALVRALGDPTLRLGMWREERGAYVDGSGGEVNPQGPGRTPVAAADGRPLALLHHDPALAEDPELLDSVAAALRLALENAWLRTRAKDVATRIVRAADAERDRLERDLHDGAQTRLVFALMAVRRVRRGLEGHPDDTLREAADEAESSLRLAIEELRGIAQGIHPAVLTREGLAPALNALARQAELPVVVAADPRRYDPLVESTAYFTVCETLTNAAKHAKARAVSVTARHQGGRLVVETVDDGVGGADSARGTGLRGLADRIAAVDGVLHIESPVGGGTRIRAELPCG
ncbi:sensor histidine kinase [Streptomyces beihaiensis]|uniref:histidine kinase n=1 Tax=Streptomyces beihaiensis TaxID=2984495 RepID=A0ABT3TY90_9ACTN|nr:histidine kinase [Streptomyces beihaiensis]MCX3062014.1 histidine kinase [Streptomyces beihaiensis]